MQLTQTKRPDAFKPVDKPDELGDISTWSYSALKVFEECAYRSFISRVKKVKEPSSAAADRGTTIHEEAEFYINGTGEFTDNLKKFQSEFEDLRALYIDAKVELESDWGFTIDWKPTGWTVPDTWARVKLDAFVHEDDNSARAIDFKTGKKFGNELNHSQQMLLYAIASFLRYEDLEFVTAELWYLDLGDSTIRTYTRDEAMEFFPGYHNRAIRMTTATKFPPNPSKQNCKWCSYKETPEGVDNPQCVWGVK